MSEPLEKSLQGYSEFVPISGNSSMSMGESLAGYSEKVPIPNASTVNRTEFEKDK